MKRIKVLRKVLYISLLFGLAAAIALPNSSAFAWPTKDITYIVPYKPGGGYDVQSRIFAPIWEKHLPQKANVIVTNRPGAGGKIGSIAMMKSAPDGQTMGLLSPSGLAMIQFEGGLEGLDIRKLSWLGQLSIDPGAVIVSAASGIKSPQDLTKREIRIGTTDDGIFGNAFFAKKLNIKARQVMFDSAPEEVLALMRGDIDMMMESWPTMKKAVDNGQGKVAPLVILADSRLSEWPDVPCSKELNLNLGDIYPLAGALRLLAAPTGLSADLKKTMEQTIWTALNDPEFKANMKKANYPTLVARGPEAADAVATIIRVFEENKNILESLKKK